MTTHWLLAETVILSMSLAGGGTYLARHAACRFRWLDKPGQHKAHSRPIPLLGGIAMYVGFILTLLIVDSQWFFSQGVTLAIAATLLAGMGLYDDLRGLNPLPKLVGQLGAGIALVSSGIFIHLTGIQGLDVALTLFWVVGICNALNLLDNMDGLSAGVSAIACVGFGAIAWVQGQIPLVVVCGTIFGITLGFLRFNWHPATIFMGDAGSLFIGFLLAALGLMVISPSAEFSGTWLVPVVILAVPIFDTTLVTFSRLRRQLKLTDGGRDHTSHRLVRMGLTVPQGVGRLYKAAGVCSAVGVAIALNPSWAMAAPSVMILGLLAIAAFFWFEQVDLSDTGQPTPDSNRPGAFQTQNR